MREGWDACGETGRGGKARGAGEGPAWARPGLALAGYASMTGYALATGYALTP